MKVVIVGRFPPPYGGVSVFVKRKYESLRGDGAGYVDLRDALWPAKVAWLVLSCRCVFYINTGNIFFLLACYFLGALSRSYIYDHNASRRNWGKGFWEVLYIYLVRRSLGVRVVHEHLREGYEKRGLGERIEVESPFLPPAEDEFSKIFESYPEAIKEFVGVNAGFKLALSASVYVRDSSGRDVYGIDALVSALEYLREVGCDPRCLLAIAEFDDELLTVDLRDRIDSLVRAGVLIKVVGQYQFWPIYRSLDVFLRLTSTDGDSISIREALYFNCPVIASDVVPRPAEVLIYHYGDQDELNCLLYGFACGRRAVED